MATISPLTIQTKYDEPCIVRNPSKADAQAWIDHATMVMQESDFTKTDPEDVTTSHPELEEWITEMNIATATLALVAEVKGRLVGTLYCRAYKASRMSHVCVFAMSVRKEWWRQGVGTALVRTLNGWATQHPLIRKVTMRVLVHNERALALYKKLGFFVEGRFAQAVKAENGKFVDDYEMSLFVKFR
ncbi:putative GCN5-related N-acetyltransferase [Nitrospira japonica]|uniref:Putative GCN5-related N-acetyltransferase n=1 Tax=Nitrospira japonica TaxID=1325564 RepID=A0A1W1I5E6_9BACT|nr:GNAT family N-acetyltransferase [Nitrospira japonica]SLM48053.1 putative GCN5-related N-acetyltransferase [Nitrospira japonica]